MSILHFVKALITGEDHTDGKYLDPLDIVRRRDEQDEKRARRLRARQRLCRIHMRRKGILAIAGYTPPTTPRAGDCHTIWRRHGWTPTGRTLMTEEA